MPMDRANLQAAFVAAGFANLIPQVDLLVRPSIRIATTPVAEANLALGTSKVGGLPDLPSGTAWPEWHGLPQSFLAQIQLADVRSLLHGVLAGLLPEQGMLWFFYDARQETFGETQADRGGWRVLFLDFPDADQPALGRATAPTGLPAESRFQACALAFTSELTFTEQPPLEIADLEWSDADQERYEALLATVAPPRGSAPRHRMLGFPDTIQDDMRLQCQLASQGITDVDDPRVAELSRGANVWQLLLQLDSDPQAGMRWASSGMVYYWARLADLQEHRFDDTWLVLQSE
jgi:uncharacterized protein YwqG